MDILVHDIRHGTLRIKLLLNHLGLARRLCQKFTEELRLIEQAPIGYEMRVKGKGGHQVISPTAKGSRGSDKHGLGRYGASRGNTRHKGRDYICVPGQDVVSPIEGLVVREARPYSEGSFSGVLIENEWITIKMFYVSPDVTLIGKKVFKGDIIGVAQDIGQKYPGITPHIHLEIVSVDPEIFIKML